MRMMTMLSGIVALTLSQTPIQAQEEATAVVKKAIEAAGGAEALDKYQAGRIEGKGKISLLGQEIEFEMTSLFQMPGKLKNVIEMQVMGTPITVNQVINGERVVMKVNGMEQPVNVWVPSIGISGLMVYTGDKFPQWRGNIFVGGMVGEQLARLSQPGPRLAQETLVPQMGRIRDVRQGPDGFIYLVTDDRDGKPTPIYRLEPVDRTTTQ